MLSFRRREGRRDLIGRLYTSVAEASRAPALYERLQMPDTLAGRFESLALHMALVLRRLRALPPPAADVAQDLVDHCFSVLDANLREIGVGDTVVPKRMKTLAGTFYAALARYDAAISAGSPDALGESIAEGLGIPAEPAADLAAYVLKAEHGLATADLDRILGGPVPWPRLEQMGEETR